MSRKRFVDEDSQVTIKLDDGATVTMKREISVGDYERLTKQYGTDTDKYPPTAMLAILLVDWSFTDKHDIKIPLTIENLARMSMYTVNEIVTAINDQMAGDSPFGPKVVTENPALD